MRRTVYCVSSRQPAARVSLQTAWRQAGQSRQFKLAALAGKPRIDGGDRRSVVNKIKHVIDALDLQKLRLGFAAPYRETEIASMRRDVGLS